MQNGERSTHLRRILVADDEHLVSAGIVTSVKSLGYEAIGPVADGVAAIALATEQKPDLAVLDIKMPTMDGLTCAKALWETLAIPSIIVSAYSSEQYVNQAQDRGIFGYLIKPVNAESLRAAISVAWARAVSTAEQDSRIDQLERTLSTRRIVEMAKWRLVESLSWSEQDAHNALQRTARARRQKLSQVAQNVLDADEGQWDLDVPVTG